MDDNFDIDVEQCLQMFENEDESPTVLTNNIIKYSYLLYISTHYSESSSDSNHMT